MDHSVDVDRKTIKLICNECFVKFNTPIEFEIYVGNYSETKWKLYWGFWAVHEKCLRYPVDDILDAISRHYEEDKEVIAQFYSEPEATFLSVKEKYLTYRKNKAMTVTERSSNNSEEIDRLKQIFNPVRVDAA